MEIAGKMYVYIKSLFIMNRETLYVNQNGIEIQRKKNETKKLDQPLLFQGL